MLSRVVAICILGLIASCGHFYLLKSSYPFVVASPEARASIEVTEAQHTELKAAQLQSEAIAFGAFGVLLCVAVALVGLPPNNAATWLITLLAAGLLGALAGGAMSFLGHLFHDSFAASIADPLVHTVLRLTVMLLPVAIAAGIVAALARRSKQVASDAIVGALLGALLTAVAYGVLAGSVTSLENIGSVLPADNQNRFLLFSLAMVCIGVACVYQAFRRSKVNASAEVETV